MFEDERPWPYLKENVWNLQALSFTSLEGMSCPSNLKKQFEVNFANLPTLNGYTSPLVFANGILYKNNWTGWCGILYDQ